MNEEEYIGRQISHYRITGRLGHGGMGVVYRAEDVRLKRTVALKALVRNYFDDEEYEKRFLREAQTASAINHPNICTIYDIIKSASESFIVMEYVEGVTLRGWLSSKGKTSNGTPKVSELEAIDIIKQVSNGLGSAHDKGIVHRDIKPENIMLDSNGLVKVMDFGLARHKTDSKLTHTGSTLGTLLYMAPEQLKGVEANRQSDIYSVGLVLYEILSGRLPFQADHEAALIYAKLNTPPTPLNQLCPGLQQEFSRIVMKCLSTEPNERYQTLAELRGDLEEFGRSSRTEVVKSSKSEVPQGTTVEVSARNLAEHWYQRLSRRDLLVLLLLGVVMIAGFLFFIFSHPENTLDLGRVTIRELLTKTSEVKEPTISTDGKWIAYVGVDDSRHANIYVQAASEGDSKKVTADTSLMEGGSSVGLVNNNAMNGGPSFVSNEDLIVYEHASAERVAIDSMHHLITFIAFRRDIRFVSILGGVPRSIVVDGGLPIASWDGSRIALVSKKAVWLGGLKDRNRRILWTIPDSLNVDDIAWSRDNKRIALATSRGIDILDTNGTHAETIPLPGHAILGLCWSSTGSFVISSIAEGRTGLWILTEKDRSLHRLTLGKGEYTHPRIDGSATRLVCAYRSRSSNLYSLDLKSGERRQITFEDSFIENPWYSPDGNQLLFIKNGEFYLSGPLGEDPVKADQHSGEWVRMAPSFPQNDRRFGGIVEEWSSNRKYALILLMERGGEKTLVDTSSPQRPLAEFNRDFFRGHFSKGSESMVYYEEVSRSFIRINLADGQRSTVFKLDADQVVGDFVVLGDGTQLICTLRDERFKEHLFMVRLSRGVTSPEHLGLIPKKGLVGGWTVSPDLSRVIFSEGEERSRILVFENFKL